MEDLQAAQGARQDADDITGEMARRRRQQVAAVRDTLRSGPQPEDHAQAGRRDWHPAASGRRKRHRSREYQAARGPADPIIVTLLAGLVAEVVVPWAVIWLSDVLFFDVPAWSLWLVFGVAPALTFLAALIQCALRTWGRQPVPATMPTRQGRG
jgi:hypothetical protein